MHDSAPTYTATHGSAPSPAPRAYTAAETAVILRQSLRTVRYLIASGELDSYKSGRSRRVPDEAIRAYQAKRIEIEKQRVLS